MVAFSSSFVGRNERWRFIQYNTEHSEHYWLQSYLSLRQSHVVLLLDCTDRVARSLATQLQSADRIGEFVRSCAARDVMPTLHAALPVALAMGVLQVLHPGFVHAVANCPDDQFCVWCVAAGGSSLAYRQRPSVPIESNG